MSIIIPGLTVAQIADALSRTQRWNGQTLVPYSVAQHCLAMYEVALSNSQHPFALLTVLHHDDEEALTGDIPFPYKTPGQSELGDQIRMEIWRKTLGLIFEPTQMLDTLDQAMADAEAHILLAPAQRALFDKPIERYSDIVWSVLDMAPREQAHLFEEVTLKLLRDPKIKALKGRI